MRPHRMALMLLAVLSVACAPPPLPRPARVADVDKARATPKRMAAAPEPRATIAPSKLLEEGDIGETAELTPALEAAAPTPTPTPHEVAALSPQRPTPGAVPANEPESLLTHIGPTTPPNVAAALRLIEDGRQQMDPGHYDRALDRIERGVTVDPANAYGYYFLAQLHFQTKKYDQAVAFASRAVVLSARTDRVLMGRSYGLEGAAFEAVGRYPDARKAYEKAVEADPNNLAARVGVARLNPTE
jgi:tetratricopeptide (TPR) repeat protein